MYQVNRGSVGITDFCRLINHFKFDINIVPTPIMSESGIEKMESGNVRTVEIKLANLLDSDISTDRGSFNDVLESAHELGADFAVLTFSVGRKGTRTESNRNLIGPLGKRIFSNDYVKKLKKNINDNKDIINRGKVSYYDIDKGVRTLDLFDSISNSVLPIEVQPRLSLPYEKVKNEMLETYTNIRKSLVNKIR